MEYDQNDKNRLLAYYNKLMMDNVGNTAQSQGWASNETENTRFNILLKIGDINNCSILDVGCGFGDLYNFFKKKDLNFSYTGIDVNPEMIKIAKERHLNVDFQIIDFSSYVPKEKFDYIFCSGALSFKVKDYKNLYFSYIKKMFEISKVGVVFNMLNSQNNSSDEDSEIFATYEISEVREFCLQLTDKIIISEDYLPNDFTFFLYH